MKGFIAVVLTLFLVRVGEGAVSKSVPEGWGEDLEAAKATAKKEGKFVLIAFSGSDWCGFCRRLAAEVFMKPEFVKAARKKYELVMIDNPRDKSILSELAAQQNPKLVAQYRVGGYPMVVIADAYGDRLKTTSGYKRGGPQAYLKALDDLMEGVKWPAPGDPGPRRPESERVMSGGAPRRGMFEPYRNKNGTSTPEGWFDDYLAAQAEARRSGRRVFLVVTRSDSGWDGGILTKNVFSRPEFTREIVKKYVPVYLDTAPRTNAVERGRQEAGFGPVNRDGSRIWRCVAIQDAFGQTLLDLKWSGSAGGVEERLKALAQAEATLEIVMPAKARCAVIMDEALQRLDPGMANELYQDEIYELLLADFEKYADRYFLVARIKPLMGRLSQVENALRNDCGRCVNEMVRAGRKESRQSLFEEAEAQLRKSKIDFYMKMHNAVLDEIHRLETKTADRTSRQRLLECEKRVIQSKAALLGSR